MKKATAVELLAPAGNAESLVAAVNNGADAVYLGLDRFNARMKADNFTLETLKQYVNYCHLYDVKLYVTVNTSVKENEFDEACNLIREIYYSFADGIIVTEPALIKYAASFVGQFDVSASTQLNVHDVYGALFAAETGATTVVAARETSYSDLKEMSAINNLRLECFVQGALCVCMSGQCLLSSLVGGNSGNRGLCAQPCRKLYRCTDARGKTVCEGRLLSPKDLCALSFGKELVKAGAKVFKIEGRGRRAVYSGEASAVYKEYIENEFVCFDDMLTRLKTVYNRGDYVGDAYASGQNDGIIYSKTQGHIGIYAGKIEKGKLNAVFPVSKGDCFKIFQEKNEVGMGTAAEDGSCVLLNSPLELKNGMTARLTNSMVQNKRVSNAKKTLAVSFFFTARCNEKISLTAKCRDTKVTLSGAEAEKAVSSPVTQDEIRIQLSRTGNTPFTVCEIKIESDDVYVSKSALNSLRRECLNLLSEKLIERYNASLCRAVSLQKYVRVAKKVQNETGLMVICDNESDFSDAMSLDKVTFCIARPERVGQDTLLRYTAKSGGRRWFLDIPPFTSNKFLDTLSFLENIGIVAHNVGTVRYAREKGLPYICGTGLNIFNSESAAVFSDACAFVYSKELTLYETQKAERENGYVFIDGDFTVMQTVHCPYKASFGGKCDKCGFEEFFYTDEEGNRFLIKRRVADICTFEIVNGRKLSAAAKILKGGRYCLSYDKDVVAHYAALNNGVNDGYTERRPYTKGRLFDKVN